MRNEESLRQRRRRKVMYSQRLRKRMTEAEETLWNALRDRKCAGLKFRRQSPIEWFVVDFFCIECSLVIEIDGDIHAQQLKYDEEREEILRAKKLRVLRFRNDQVLCDLHSILENIKTACGIPPLPASRRRWEGEGARG